MSEAFRKTRRSQPLYPRRLRQRRRAMIVAALIALGVGLGGLGHAEESRSAPAFRIVVHPENPLATASREYLERVFLKQTTRWRDGERIRPVDLPSDSTVRRHFSERVLKRSVQAVRNYWQQRIFSGRGLPPPELSSEEAVVRYVAKHPAGIGYVGGTVHLSGVSVVSIR